MDSSSFLLSTLRQDITETHLQLKAIIQVNKLIILIYIL